MRLEKIDREQLDSHAASDVDRRQQTNAELNEAGYVKSLRYAPDIELASAARAHGAHVPSTREESGEFCAHRDEGRRDQMGIISFEYLESLKGRSIL